MTEPGLHFIWHPRVITQQRDIYLKSSSCDQDDLEKIYQYSKFSIEFQNDQIQILCMNSNFDTNHVKIPTFNVLTIAG